MQTSAYKAFTTAARIKISFLQPSLFLFRFPPPDISSKLHVTSLRGVCNETVVPSSIQSGIAKVSHSLIAFPVKYSFLFARYFINQWRARFNDDFIIRGDSWWNGRAAFPLNTSRDNDD